MTKEKIESVVLFARSKLWRPYIWGGNGPDFFDCSGLVLAALRSVNWYPQGEDNTAQGLYQYLSSKNWIQKLDRGSIVFFGKSREKITHVGIALDAATYISAAGGDKSCTTVEKAQKKGACVKITDIRKDLISYLYPV